MVITESTEYSTYPEGKRDWFYTLFGPCFAKPFIEDNQYYHKVIWFKYTTDGKKCISLHPAPNDYETDFDSPECLFFCSLLFRFIRRNICCDRR